MLLSIQKNNVPCFCMKLIQLKNWINTLSDDFLNYECVYSVYENAQDTTVESWSRQDKLITSCYIDENHTECTFSSNRPEPLCRHNYNEQENPVTKPKKPTKKTKKKLK